MANRKKVPVLVVRTSVEITDYLEEFRQGQIARPTQTEALKALVKLGFETWKAREERIAAAEAP